jgi:methyl-accepting chemotaxis protein
MLARSLQAKLIAFSLLCGAVPLAGFTAWAAWYGGNSLGAATTAAETALTTAAGQRLAAIRDVMRGGLSEYEAGVRADVEMLASDPTTRTALQRFATSFAEADGDDQPVAILRQDLTEYYATFDAEYARQNPGSRSPSGDWLARLAPAALRRQRTWIWQNPHPLGKKHLLDRLDGDDSGYAQAHGELHPHFRRLVERVGYYDVFLVDLDGTVVYSVFKELDFATSLRTGAHADSDLGKVVQQALQAAAGSICASDFHRYAPSYEAAAAFAAAPVFAGEQRIGAVAVQLPLDRISRVMGQTGGLGSTGEAFLVGADHRMRSDSRRDPTHLSVQASFRDPSRGLVRNDAVERALAGKDSVGAYQNHLDREVHGACAGVEFLGQRWAMCVEQEAEEALAAARALARDGQARQSAFVQLGALVCAAIAAATAAAGWWLARRLAAPARAGANALAAVATGDLRPRLQTTSQDELGAMSKSLNLALDALGQTLAQAQRGITGIDATTGDLRSCSQSLADSASQTAASLEEMRATIAEIVQLSSTTAGETTAANQLAQQAQASVVTGRAATDRMARTMQEAQEAAAAVTSVLSTIDSIAFQTNLLALNAAVEAARAGDAGRGFAVVAEEVRNLAQRSAGAAKETAERIRASTERTNAGAQAVQEVLASFAAIDAAQQKVSGLIANVQQATHAESGHLQTVDQAVARIDAMTQTNASAAEQLTASVATTQEQTTAMRRAMEQFVLADG